MLAELFSKPPCSLPLSISPIFMFSLKLAFYFLNYALEVLFSNLLQFQIQIVFVAYIFCYMSVVNLLHLQRIE